MVTQNAVISNCFNPPTRFTKFYSCGNAIVTPTKIESSNPTNKVKSV